MVIRIIQGTYGYKTPGGSLDPVDCGGTCDVNEAEAKRLVGLGVAEVVEGKISEPAEVVVAPEDDVEEVDLEDMSFAELKDLAEQMNIDTKGIKSKAKLIAAIEAEGDELPDLSVEVPQ